MTSAIIYPLVKIGSDYSIEQFVLVGKPTKDVSKDPTLIGNHAVIRSHSVIYEGNQIGHHFQTGHHVLIREHNKIGNYVSIGSSSIIEHHINIGNNVRIHSRVFIPEYSILEDGCWIGPNTVLTNAKYPNNAKTKNNLQGVIIKKDAIIGANVTILPGVQIGNNAIIGAGSLVTKNIPDQSVAIGNPARVIKKRAELEDYKI